MVTRATAGIRETSKAADEPTSHSIKEQPIETLMEGYLVTFFRLIVSNRERGAIVRSMEAIGRVYEVGTIALMRQGQSDKAQAPFEARRI